MKLVQTVMHRKKVEKKQKKKQQHADTLPLLEYVIHLKPYAVYRNPSIINNCKYKTNQQTNTQTYTHYGLGLFSNS